MASDEMGTVECLKVLEQIASSFHPLGVSIKVNFTGGDPLLRSDITTIVAHAVGLGMRVGILGNPDLLTEEKATALKSAGLQSYQVSIDGMEETHDRIRGVSGAFKSALEAIQILQGAGIESLVMFTLNRANANELDKVIELVVNEGASSFAFARTVPIGKATQAMSAFSPEEYRNLLLKADALYSRLEDQGVETRLKRKDNLWRLLHLEMGKMDPVAGDGIVRGGCVVGYKALSISAEGVVYACPRIPIPVGNLRRQDLLDIFLGSPILEDLRQIEQHKKCRLCPLFLYCRGCPAVAYAVTGDYFGADPHCWRTDE
jgi:radical SAM protein with 4Fe4S-binding SPASM domain